VTRPPQEAAVSVSAPTPSVATPDPDGPDADVATLARRADQLREQVRHLPDPTAAALLDDALDAMTAFNRAGLVDLVRAVRADPAGAQALYQAMESPAVMALLAAHDIIRTDRTLDVLRAAEQLGPYLDASGVTLTVVEVDATTARIRLAAAGCGAVDAGLTESVRAALRSRVPGLADVQVLPDAPAAEAGPAFVPLTALRVGAPQ
jgi:Fe-S cluster biogenesis protein NfuA